MDESYEAEQSEPLDEGMDEFLCEYVDGAMDPVVLKAFEEYLRANPDMAEHVQCLCQARKLLSSQASCHHPSASLQARLHDAIARDLMGDQSSSFVSRLGSFALLTSAMGLMVMLGILFGSTVIQGQSAQADFAMTERVAVPSDAHPGPMSVPAFAPEMRRAALHVAGPTSALPTLAISRQMTPMRSNFAAPQP